MNILLGGMGMDLSAFRAVVLSFVWAGGAVAAVILIWLLARKWKPRRLARLVSNEAGYSAVVDALSEGVLIYGDDGQVKACNPAAGAILGRSPHQLIGTGAFGEGWQLADESGAAFTADNHPVAQVLRTGKPKVSCLLKVETPEGQSRWLQSSVTAMPPNATFGQGAAVAKLRDVTTQRLEQEMLKEAERTFRHLFEYSPNAVSITRACDGLVLEVNAAWCRLFSWTREETLGRTLLDLGIWFRPEDRTSLLAAITADGNLNTLPFVTTRKDGTVLHTTLGLAPLELNGQACLIAVLHDHTHLQQAASARLQVVKHESLGLMAAGLSHGFNNLFQSLLTSLEMAHAQSDHSGRNFLARAMTSLERASGLSRRLLEFSGGSFTQMESLPLNPLIREVLAAGPPGANVRTQLDLAEELPEIRADRGQLQRVLGVLLENAVEVIGARSGSIQISTHFLASLPAEALASGQWMVAAPGSPWVRLSISDTGGGVTPEVLESMFDPFFGTKALGRGLGLSAALGLLRGHQAGFQVMNRPGEGMTFNVYLSV